MKLVYEKNMDALLIRQKAGNDAAREVRMMIQSLQRKLQG